MHTSSFAVSLTSSQAAAAAAAPSLLMTREKRNIYSLSGLPLLEPQERVQQMQVCGCVCADSGSINTPPGWSLPHSHCSTGDEMVQDVSWKKYVIFDSLGLFLKA